MELSAADEFNGTLQLPNAKCVQVVSPFTFNTQLNPAPSSMSLSASPKGGRALPLLNRTRSCSSEAPSLTSLHSRDSFTSEAFYSPSQPTGINGNQTTPTYKTDIERYNQELCTSLLNTYQLTQTILHSTFTPLSLNPFLTLLSQIPTHTIETHMLKFFYSKNISTAIKSLHPLPCFIYTFQKIIAPIHPLSASLTLSLATYLAEHEYPYAALSFSPSKQSPPSHQEEWHTVYITSYISLSLSHIAKNYCTTPNLYKHFHTQKYIHAYRSALALHSTTSSSPDLDALFIQTCTLYAKYERAWRVYTRSTKAKCVCREITKCCIKAYVKDSVWEARLWAVYTFWRFYKLVLDFMLKHDLYDHLLSVWRDYKKDTNITEGQKGELKRCLGTETLFMRAFCKSARKKEAEECYERCKGKLTPDTFKLVLELFGKSVFGKRVAWDIKCFGIVLPKDTNEYETLALVDPIMKMEYHADDEDELVSKEEAIMILESWLIKLLAHYHKVIDEL